MKNLRLCAALPLFAVALVVAPAATNNVVLPEQLFPQLDGILKKAVQQSPRMLSRALLFEIAENDRIVARASLLPSVGASYSYYKSKDKSSLLYEDPLRNSVNSYTLTKTPYSLSLSQPIFHWGALRNSDRMGEIQLNMAQGQYREAYRLLAQTLRNDYLRLIVLKLSAKRAHFNQELTTNQLKQEEERLTKKVISDAEIFSVRINAERAQIAADRAEFELNNAINSFVRLAGTGTAFTVEDIPDSIPEARYDSNELNQLLAGFLKQKDPINPDAITARQEIEIQKLDYAINKTRLWPKANFSMGISQSEDANYYGTGAKYLVTSQYAGVSINWNIFDGFVSGAVVRKSLSRVRMMENSYRQLTETLAQDAQSQVKSLDLLARSMSISDRLVVSGEGNLRAKNEEFGRGVRAEAEVNQAKLSLYDTQIGAYTDRRVFIISAGDFLGSIMEDPVLANLSAK